LTGGSILNSTFFGLSPFFDLYLGAAGPDPGQYPVTGATREFASENSALPIQDKKVAYAFILT